MLDNITRNFETESRRDQMLHNLTEGNRASLANCGGRHARVRGPHRGDVGRVSARWCATRCRHMSQRLTTSAERVRRFLKARWPLEEMLGADLIAAAQRPHRGPHRPATKLEEVDGPGG